ncbi:MAG: hypothetical protein FJY10_04980 [Bacteroidetes bacterium]|nr:hypothetical protein [Bacteroidota bacterium]
MEIDIRLPIGAMFTLLGLLLTIFGLVTSSNDLMYLRSLGFNVNLWSGLLMLVFGLVLLFLTWRKRRFQKSIEHR